MLFSAYISYMHRKGKLYLAGIFIFQTLLNSEIIVEKKIFDKNSTPKSPIQSFVKNSRNGFQIVMLLSCSLIFLVFSNEKT